MNVLAPPVLRQLDRFGIQPFLPLLDEWLLPGAAYGVAHTWPQLYRSDGDGRFGGLFAGDRLVSHCAWRFAEARTEGGAMPVALLGSVATDPTERGRGHATRLLEHALADCRRAGVRAVLLWAERPELYARVGFLPGGIEECLVLDAGAAAVADAGVRLAAVADHGALHELHAQKPRGIVRSRREMSGMLTTPGMWTCVLERDGAVRAYACIGKGADLPNWWHEVGGSCADVAALLPAAMQLVGMPQAIALLPPYRGELRERLRPITLEAATIAGPMVAPLDGGPLPPFWVDGLDSV